MSIPQNDAAPSERNSEARNRSSGAPDFKYPAQHKFLTLDMLRGIAAFLILNYHVLFWRSTTAPHRVYSFHTYLAVDSFFVLSGFVLSHAYQNKLDRGLSTLAFMKVRLVRLYPLYILGTGLGFLYEINSLPHKNLSGLASLFAILLPAIFMLPLPPLATYAGKASFMFDYPAWSLFYELVANLVHGLFLRRRSTRTLAVVTTLLGACLVPAILLYGKADHGVYTIEAPFALVRVFFSYIYGMLVYRLWHRLGNKQTVSSILPVALLIIVFTVPSLGRLNALYDIAMITLVLPAIILLGASAKPLSRMRSTAVLLGTTSYAAYVLHTPLGWLFASLAAHLPRLLAPDTNPRRIACLTVIIGLCIAADAFYDVPARRWLRTKFTAT